MSRIGKRPVAVGKAEASVAGNVVTVKGPKGTRTFSFDPARVTVSMEEGALSVQPVGLTKLSRQHWGMVRSMLENLVTGVTTGFKKELELVGVGYRATMNGKNLKLALGYSHDVDFVTPEGVTITSPKQTEIIVEGIDQQLVGQVAANIRNWRSPEPYKGKGIKYKGEFIFRKEGKKK
jgi:large subunit ribosomal protein L6